MHFTQSVHKILPLHKIVNIKAYETNKTGKSLKSLQLTQINFHKLSLCSSMFINSLMKIVDSLMYLK